MGAEGIKKWILPLPYPESGRGNAGFRAEIHPVILSVLKSRGLHTSSEIGAFLKPSETDLLDPFLLRDMDRAVDRIEKAIRNSEPVVVFGDYDVDGVTSTALLLEYLGDRGLEASFYIPDRMKEGYGLNEDAIREFHGRGIRLIITADCGTTSVDEIGLARDLGMDVIVVDHHEVPDPMPHANAFLNPKRPDSKYPETVLCTAGLAFKMIQALSGEIPEKYLDLVALGTIADVAPLNGENRFLVKAGLQVLSEGKRPGVAALKDVAELREKEVRTGTVGFRIAPRINAGGRLGMASPGVRLLRTDSDLEARTIAGELNRQNQKRQEVEAGILNQAVKMVEESSKGGIPDAIVLASEGWHLGVIGIVAARLAERFHRPAILLAIGSDGVARGSARSIPGFHLYEAVSRCRDVLLRFGGHRAAAGLALRSDRLTEFREKFTQAVSEVIEPDGFIPRQRIDAEVVWNDLSRGLVSGLEDLQPFGMGNPEPAFLVRGGRPISPRIVGKNHLKFSIRRADGKTGNFIDVIGFRMGERLKDLSNGNPQDLVFVPEINIWQGRERLQLRLKDFRLSETARTGETDGIDRDPGQGSENFKKSPHPDFPQSLNPGFEV
ncbi:MAG TPA: single-stranded-DNA-specific exonuclease RecJ [Nitrospiria bacterium]